MVFLLKPGTMLLIIALAVGGVRSDATGTYAMWVVAALVASVVGDVALMLGRFLPGLSAFLVAHLLYIYAVWGTLPVRLVPADVVTGLAMLLYAGYLIRRMEEGMRASGQRALLVPVTVYIAVIAVMVWRSVGLVFQPGALPVSGALVAVGAVLFCVSDTILGWNKFVRPVAHRDLLVMSTYFAAQYCFALSCTL
ncbi:MAG TPA: lysoplasmalogenase [Symbiobacteriaceae bacterium]|nr:lysoplasmalogenase [Symbiobacteriaceae bacterium]